ncbi:enzymatic polyprotein endonuclease reverse [Lasius niger]|uniref:RNA-directed DNA polymerase n=1 Tax=Lasius niger TaxID=67767 RepID=A0A0J7KM44_LASNI|nr:enzymatic polyprotein endonuclease reverse [Lasius niger]KMQ91309.1 enzymatic polyprotein endonuclease reverse [Lasius niger]
MLMPQVIIEEIAQENTEEINTAQIKEKELDIPRSEKVLQLLRTQHLNAEEKKAIIEICKDFSDVLHLDGEPLTCTDDVAHQIATQADSSPLNVRPPSTSQWNAPLLVVPKKTNASGKPKLRVVVDFRELNDLTIGDSFPLPNITDILDQLGNAKFFTILDLASGYHQIPMEESDKSKTAFSTPYGHYKYNRMSFGLKNAPATFQRLMNSILTGMQGIKCLVYLDDIVIYGASLQEHNKRLIEVLRRLRENNLKLQPEKCEFLRKEVTYLEHIITENGISPDPSKLEAVKNFPTPSKVKDVQAFIEENKFQWTQEQQHALEILKEKLTTAPVLKYPDFTQEFIVMTDASDYAIGAILSQGKIGEDQPVAYASRVLSRAEQNYNTTEKELAIVWAVKHFRPYLYGTKFTIVTDHKSLVWLFNVTDPGSRLMRWRLKLEEYDYVIVHKAGQANRNADALSRYVADINKVEEEETNDTDTAKRYTEEEKQRILYEYHDAPVGGHQGVERTINRIRLTHNWRGITRDVEEYIAKCERCQKNKLTRKNKAPSLVAWSTCMKNEPDTREPFLLTKFATEPGIYFEKIGQMNQAELTWKMTAYQTPKNARRGLLDGIGIVAKTLFGTMDADDEKKIAEQLNLLQNQQQTLQHAAKNQIKILNTTIAHVDNLEKVLQENEERFLNITIRMRDQRIGYGQREDLDEHFLTIEAIIADLTHDTEDIIEHLTNAKNGVINPQKTG